MFDVTNRFKPPTNIRRSYGQPSAVEQRVFDAFMRQYRATYTCQLTINYFDVESRIATFHGPAGFVCAHSPSRCKYLTRQMKWMKG